MTGLKRGPLSVHRPLDRAISGNAVPFPIQERERFQEGGLCLESMRFVLSSNRKGATWETEQKVVFVPLRIGDCERNRNWICAISSHRPISVRKGTI